MHGSVVPEDYGPACGYLGLLAGSSLVNPRPTGWWAGRVLVNSSLIRC